MENITNFKILKGLPLSLLEEAAKIYYYAFRQKINLLFGGRKKAVKFIKKYTNFDSCFYFISNGLLLGIAGIQYKNNNFNKNLAFKELVKDFNFFRALLIKFVYRFKNTGIDEDIIRIDSLAVAREYRGRGIGTALIEEIFEYARKNNLKKVMLEVVNTNKKAKKLYEKMGFNIVKEKKYGLITRRAGFSSEFMMVKNL